MEAWGVPLLAALFGMLGAWVGARLAFKAQTKATQIADDASKRSDFTIRALAVASHRVEWIQRLRDEMAIFQSWGMTPSLISTEHRESYEHGTRIELLMNPNDPDFARLQTLMNELLFADSAEKKYSLNVEYVEVCQRILKREWEVAKRETLDDPLF